MSEKHNEFCKELGNTNNTNEESNFFAAAVERDESQKQLADAKAQFENAKVEYDEAKSKLKEAEEFDKMARKFINTPADPKLNHDEVAYGKIKTAEIAGDKLSRAQIAFNAAEKNLNLAEEKLSIAQERIEGSKAFARE